jgi:Mn-dependent DtxR family transcriptional regulator
MKKEIIGEAAGRIWETLEAKSEVSIAQLPKSLKMKTDIAYQALGWLAREDKIDYHDRGGKVYVSLSENERASLAEAHTN